MDDVIINADDLGMTPGTNRAIFDAYDAGGLTHASIMTNADYFQDALQEISKRPKLQTGIHLNLSYGRALCGNPLLCRGGILNKGFVALYIDTEKNPKILGAIEEEMESQIVMAIENGVKIGHLDSHRHVHLIPKIFGITAKLAKKYRIPRIRLIDENLFESVKFTKNIDFFSNAGILKYLLLKKLSQIDAKRFALARKTKFFSILFTGKITHDAIERIYRSGKPYEVMVHPGYSRMDEPVEFYDDGERRYRVSNERDAEFEALMKFSRNIRKRGVE